MTNDPQKNDSFAREVGRGLVEEAKDSLRSAALGALLGAIVVGGGGLYYFGLFGLGAGAVVGALVGGAMFWFAHMEA